MVNQYLKENIEMGKEEKEKNLKMVNQNSKVNINLVVDGKEKNTIKKENLLLNILKEIGKKNV